MIGMSYSRLKIFETCRRQFELKFITKELPYVENAAMKEGSRKHKILERAALTLKKESNTVLPPSNMSHVYPILISFNNSHDEIYPELDLAFRKDLSIGSWFGKDIWLRCKIDLLGVKRDAAGTEYVHQNDIVSIIDWKSGKVRVDIDQLRLYNIAALIKYSEAREAHSSLVFIDQKQSSKVVKTKREDIQLELNEFSDRFESVQIASERNSWPPSKNMFCNWCGANVLQCEYK